MKHTRMRILSKIFYLLLFSVIPNTLCAINLLPESIFPSYHAHKAYNQKNYTKTQNILEKKQVDSPNDPLINYNLGTTYFKQKKYEAALQSFERAAKHAFGKNNEIVEKARFNAGNCLYRQTLKTLGPNWEKEKPDKAIAAKAIESITKSIDAYKKTLLIDPASKQAQANKKIAEELLKKLQEQKQDKKDKDKKDKDKKDKDKKDQDKQDQDKQKQKQDNKEKDKDKKDQDKQEQDKQETQSVDTEPKEEDLEKRRMASLLKQLEQKEKELQKKLFKQKVDVQIKPNNQFQKPW